eukprot:587143-Hanusia_phi.AAC.1
MEAAWQINAVLTSYHPGRSCCNLLSPSPRSLGIFDLSAGNLNEFCSSHITNSCLTNYEP